MSDVDDYGYDPLNKEHRRRRLEHREIIADRLAEARDALAELEHEWTRGDFHPDTLSSSGKEWPFAKALEDVVADMGACVARIRQVNELLELEPITVTVDAVTWDALTAALEEPAREVPELARLLARGRDEWATS